MKKIGLFLLAVVMVVGVAGCGGGSDFSPTYSNMAGVYTPTKVTYTEGATTVTFVPPDISGSMSLSTAGRFDLDFTLRGERVTGSGTYGISGDVIVFSDGAGPITDDGRKFSITGVEAGQTMTIEFTRS
jgi:hypothetical protein